jgi:hypothetical protein
MGMTARGQGPDPCEPGSFNPGVCKTAVRHHGYCSGGAWVPMTYSQKYPNYYDSYQTYASGGGLVNAAAAENCGHSTYHSGFVSHGGFGHIGGGHRAGG